MPPRHARPATARASHAARPRQPRSFTCPYRPRAFLPGLTTCLTTKSRFCGRDSSFDAGELSPNWGFICECSTLIWDMAPKTAKSSRRISNSLYARIRWQPKTGSREAKRAIARHIRHAGEGTPRCRGPAHRHSHAEPQGSSPRGTDDTRGPGSGNSATVARMTDRKGQALRVARGAAEHKKPPRRKWPGRLALRNRSATRATTSCTGSRACGRSRSAGGARG